MRSTIHKTIRRIVIAPAWSWQAQLQQPQFGISLHASKTGWTVCNTALKAESIRRERIQSTYTIHPKTVPPVGTGGTIERRVLAGPTAHAATYAAVGAIAFELEAIAGDKAVGAPSRSADVARSIDVAGSFTPDPARRRSKD